jgi:hypothetical protein
MKIYRYAMRKHVGILAAGLSMYTAKAWAVTGLTAAVGLALIGLVTAIYENPFFIRMTAVRTQDYVIWTLSSVLMGLIVGSHFVANSTGGDGGTLSGGLLSVLSVGCPTCNKLVVLLLGTTGALTFFAPVQLYIGIASVLLLGWALFLRAKALAATCAVIHVPSIGKGEESFQSP